MENRPDAREQEVPDSPANISSAASGSIEYDAAEEGVEDEGSNFSFARNYHVWVREAGVAASREEYDRLVAEDDRQMAEARAQEQG